jgi:pyruvate,water dikinase
MMSLIVDLSDTGSVEPSTWGGKAAALSSLMDEGFRVPGGLVLTTGAYVTYIRDTRLLERILLEVHRKRSEDMRWEEMWDTALRIRHMFQTTPLPRPLHEKFYPVIEERFGQKPVVVRSSAAAEDSASASYAGLHESYVNVRGVQSILDHIRFVWASLWSDSALMYTEERGVDPESDAMAVIIQEMADGERSGVAFTADPTDSARGAIEAIHGLNKGLVDGDVEPDRWFIRRSDGKLLGHDQPVRDRWVRATGDGLSTEPLGERASLAPLSSQDVHEIWDQVIRIEQIFGSPQDVEWTFRDDVLYILQARPITTGVSGEPERGSKAWNLGLKRSFDHLVELRERIEKIHFPAMEQEAAELTGMDIDPLTDRQLAGEINRRSQIFKHWEDVYWDEFIPMAHGVRLFGQFYNDIMAPEDPFQFVDLLRDTPLISKKRNAELTRLAEHIRQDQDLARSLKKGKALEGHEEFDERLDRFMEQYGDLTWGGSRLSANREALVGFLLNLASAARHETQKGKQNPQEDLAARFLQSFPEDRRKEGERLLDLARASWHLRDDDNILLGRIEGQVRRSVDEGLKRLAATGLAMKDPVTPEIVAEALTNRKAIPQTGPIKPVTREKIEARQLVGQPAVSGTARGLARVVLDYQDLSDYQAGQILVCDSIDPNMTLLVPMASAIVERRGGMLIHGAIIAREYGIPCVNGVPDATRLIRTGDDITVDGYLGLVIVHGS